MTWFSEKPRSRRLVARCALLLVPALAACTAPAPVRDRADADDRTGSARLTSASPVEVVAIDGQPLAAPDCQRSAEGCPLRSGEQTMRVRLKDLAAAMADGEQAWTLRFTALDGDRLRVAWNLTQKYEGATVRMQAEPVLIRIGVKGAPADVPPAAVTSGRGVPIRLLDFPAAPLAVVPIDTTRLNQASADPARAQLAVQAPLLLHGFGSRSVPRPGPDDRPQGFQMLRAPGGVYRLDFRHETAERTPGMRPAPMAQTSYLMTIETGKRYQLAAFPVWPVGTTGVFGGAEWRVAWREAGTTRWWPLPR